MRVLFLTMLALLWLMPPATANVGFGPPDQPGLLCRQAIGAAERAHAIPAHLLAAIGRVESGRRDPATGLAHPWPWTINAEGDGHFFDTKAQAVAAVKALQARGVRSIDIGCMQVNLMHHPRAFPSLEQAFDPNTNADYAARFLRDLFAQTNAWPKAAGMYHSATPEFGDPYQKQVMAIWPDEMRNQMTLAGSAAMPPLASPSPLARAWSATMQSPTPPFPRGPIARIIPLTRAPDGTVPLGRDLAAYRAAPVMATIRPLNRAGG